MIRGCDHGNCPAEANVKWTDCSRADANVQFCFVSFLLVQNRFNDIRFFFFLEMPSVYMLRFLLYIFVPSVRQYRYKLNSA